MIRRAAELYSICFCLSFFFCSYLWGALADYKGRKPTIIASLLLIGLSAFVFGFSVNYGMAIAFRFAAGLFNGEPAIMSLTDV